MAEIPSMCHPIHRRLCCVPNFAIQEYAALPDSSRTVFDWELEAPRWQLLSVEKLGQGVQSNEDEEAKYPYNRRYLAANRLADGRLWNR